MSHHPHRIASPLIGGLLLLLSIGSSAQSTHSSSYEEPDDPAWQKDGA